MALSETIKSLVDVKKDILTELKRRVPTVQGDEGLSSVPDIIRNSTLKWSAYRSVIDFDNARLTTSEGRTRFFTMDSYGSVYGHYSDDVCRVAFRYVFEPIPTSELTGSKLELYLGKLSSKYTPQTGKSSQGVAILCASLYDTVGVPGTVTLASDGSVTCTMDTVHLNEYLNGNTTVQNVLCNIVYRHQY